MSHGHEFESPVDLAGGPAEDGHALRWVTIAIATASLFLLFANAASIRQWVDEQTPGPLQARAQAMAMEWEAFTDRIGIGTPRAALHQQWKAAQATRFSEGDQR